MKIRKLNLVILAGHLAVAAAHAEISGSGSPNANCAGGEITGQVRLQTPGQPGLEGVAVRLTGTGNSLDLTAITGPDGAYGFVGLCGDDYHLSILEETLPGSLTLTEQPAAINAQGVIVLDDNQPSQVGVNYGYSTSLPAPGCALSLEAGCSVASLATELYQCSKRVNELSLTWNGEQDIRVVAHNGKLDDEIVADIDNIAPGDRVTVGGMPGDANEVIWQLYAAGTDIALGQSQFRMECDDVEMDGPEDCGTAQGNGKDNKDQYSNDWLLAGLKDASGIINCEQPVVSESCNFQPVRADCASIDKARMLTLMYTGGACDESVHGQPDKFQCDGMVDPLEPVTVINEDGDSFTVRPGEAFSTPVDGSDTELELTNAGGTQTLKIHTSCSQPLAAGDVYGGLLLGAINGLGVIAPVDYEYVISNTGSEAAGVVTVQDSLETLGSQAFELDAMASTTLHRSAWVRYTRTNTIAADGVNTQTQCAAADLVTAVVAPLPDCSVSETGRELHDKELRLTLRVGADAPATVARIEVSWPAAAGKLKEAKLDGDKFFDQEVEGPDFVIDASNIVGELHKRKIERNDERMLKLVFKEDIEGLPQDAEVTVYFEEGCSISW